MQPPANYKLTPKLYTLEWRRMVEFLGSVNAIPFSENCQVINIALYIAYFYSLSHPSSRSSARQMASVTALLKL